VNRYSEVKNTYFRTWLLAC